jgi:SAM-dependent methyltransferase
MKTAWYNTDALPTSMLTAGFRPLQESDHFASLSRCVELSDGRTLLDIGCGTAEASAAFPQWDYTGADLPHIIEKVSKVSNPSGKYISIDANETNFEFTKQYDLILMNSFLSEVPEWYIILNKILLHSEGDILIHRQEITNTETHLDNYTTYGNLPTIKTILNYENLMNTFRFNGFGLVEECQSFPYNSNHRTFLFRKDEAQ